MIKSMEKGPFHGRMESNIRGLGSLGNSMDWGFILIIMGNKEKEYGSKGKEFSGLKMKSIQLSKFDENFIYYYYYYFFCLLINLNLLLLLFWR